MNEANDPVKEYKALKKKKNHDEALQMLKRLASQVKPILIKHQWTIKNLCEFFPTNPNLLGVNVNRGWKINLRLRPHFDDSQFLEYEDILGTLLHEMAHIVRGPHDEQFYKLLEELKGETEILMASGYRGEGFYSNGHALGLNSVPRYLAGQTAAAAAEKRLRTSKIMLPAGGIRLGGSKSNADRNKTPAQLAALAALKRSRDKIWCGGSVNENGESTSGVSSPTAESSNRSLQSGVDSSSNNSGKRKDANSDINLNRNSTSATTTNNAVGNGISTTRLPVNKKTRVIVDLTLDEVEDEVEVWTCASCTFSNKPLVLVCEVCLSERPLKDLQQSTQDLDSDSNTQDFWKCPQCTLLNEKKWQVCVACTFVHLT